MLVLKDRKDMMYFSRQDTDEHGQKIELKAEEAGITPKEFVDNVSSRDQAYLGSDEYFL